MFYLESTPGGRPSPPPKPLPLWAAAAIIAAGWVPTLWVVSVHVPRLAAAFGRVPEARWKLPELTRVLVTVGEHGTATLALMGLGLVSLLIALYAGWVRVGLPGRRVVVAVALSLTGVELLVLLLVGVLMPLRAVQGQ